MKVIRGEHELTANDVADFPKGLIPGEWICLADATAKRKYWAYANPQQELYYKIKILKECAWTEDTNIAEDKVAKETISELLKKALKKREIFLDYENGARLIYGASDFLPGLIVDKYKKYILVQVNTAGLDRFRDLIEKFFQENFKTHRIVFFDNEEYRKSEMLPIYDKKIIEEDLEILENNIKYLIPKTVMQKIGYYYDHRENREKLKKLISRMNLKRELGLDLFSYVGSWGLHLLSAGIRKVDFVDQANMESVVLENLKLNGFHDRGQFIRSDVFKFLDKSIEEKKQYNVIVSDPPAFTKSEKNKPMALSGYEKLHSKALKLLADEGLFVAASCTHYVSYEELDKTVQDSAIKNNLKIQLLDLGVQGFDHPMKGFKDKSFYIKYLVYYVNRG